jgi:hypothetical protein
MRPPHDLPFLGPSNPLAPPVAIERRDDDTVFAAVGIMVMARDQSIGHPEVGE